MTSEIIVAGGCFWGVQSVFSKIKGVISAQVGYTGGHMQYPTYEAVQKGLSGHTEAVLIRYNSNQITLAELLDIFFMSHNPTTPNRQGNDKGSQYRSAIFYRTATERNQIIKKINEIQPYFSEPIITEVKKVTRFWPAESEHQDYFEKHHQKNCIYIDTCREHFLCKKLSFEQYRVMRGKGTEPPFSGEYIYTDKAGVYCCAACGQKLFRSSSKYKSGSGWPSFTRSVPGAVLVRKDFSHFMLRDEVLCSRCGSHLGHLFNDGPTKTGLHYCINSVCLELRLKKGN